MSKQKTLTIQQVIDLAVQHHNEGRLSKAESIYQQILQSDPNQPVALHLLGVIAHQVGKNDTAVDLITRALALKPDYPEAHSNLGVSLQSLGKLEEAVASYRTALGLKPDFAEAHYNLGMLQLLMGDFLRGWKNYAWRWKTKQYRSLPRDYEKPSWDGGELKGKTIFVYPEQGLGDTIQFVRYLPLLKQHGRRVVFETPKSLTRLFATVGIADQLIEPGETPPTIDCHAALLDLPQLLNTTLETIPNYNSYLRTAPNLQKEWANRLGPRKKFRLGIVWAGRSAHKNDRNRSIEAFLFQPLTKIRGVSVYSLQVGRNGEAAKIFGDTVTDVAPFLNDFADTAAAVSNLDLVVSVDTSVAHIAGALGWPIWTLLPFVPDWRWLLERDDSPWYPTMQLFRQSERNDWKTVIERLRTELIKTVKLSRH